MTKLILRALAVVLGIGAAQAAQWEPVVVDEYGFRISMPAKPSSRPISTPEGWLKVYEAVDSNAGGMRKYSVFVGAAERGVFDASAQSAFLRAHLESMVKASEGGALKSSTPILFKGQPALEYVFDHRINGEAYVARGITLMVDGGHMRLSMWHPKGATNAEADYQRFRESFALTAIRFVPAPTVQVGQGLAFAPPMGWKAGAAQTPPRLATYSHMTESIIVMAAGAPSYTCAHVEQEARAAGKLRTAQDVELGAQRFRKLVSYDDVPKYGVRLAIVHYCLNHARLGASVVMGTVEEQLLPRWQAVLEGSAATLRMSN